MTPNLARAGALLRDGALIAHPTDTVMGLAAAGRLPAALERLATLKGRGEGRPFIGLIDEPGRLDGLVHSVPRYVAELVARHWPGPLTLVLPGRPGVALLAADGSLALRCPLHPLSQFLVREAAGLLASTSANRSGGPVAPNAVEALSLFGIDPVTGLALILDEDDERAAARAGGGLGVTPGQATSGSSAGRVPSTLLDCRGREPRILRAGALSAAELGLG